MPDEFAKTLEEIKGLKTTEGPVDREFKPLEVSVSLMRSSMVRDPIPAISKKSREQLEQFGINFRKKCSDHRKFKVHHYGPNGPTPETD